MSSSMNMPLSDAVVKQTEMDKIVSFVKPRWINLSIMIVCIIFSVMIGVFYFDKYKSCTGNSICSPDQNENYTYSATLLACGIGGAVCAAGWAILS